MLDIKKVKENQAHYAHILKSKEADSNVELAIKLYDQYCDVKLRLEKEQATVNQSSKAIAEHKKRGEDATKIMDAMSKLKAEITILTEEFKSLEAAYIDAASRLPNLTLPEVKVSPNKEDNVAVKIVGEKPTFNFTPKNHVELNEKLNLFDFKRGAKLSGSGWPIYRAMGAKLEWALINLMIETHLQNGYEMVMPPHMVKKDIMYGAGLLPKFGHQLFSVQDDEYDLKMIPTAEVALNGLYLGEIIEEELPLKFMSYTPCFRREAGGLGAQERGLIRVHQFNKVEMFAFTKPDQSEKMFQEMVASAESILQKLGLHYRNMLLVTGDTGFCAAKTIDLEVWLPGQNRYYEVSSVSNCTDFQARRSQTRFRGEDGKPQFVHTLNGSGLATSRLMVAFLENNQQADGSVLVPEVLQKYLNGAKKLTPQT
jgi:seryl-tRNA synthetase